MPQNYNFKADFWQLTMVYDENHVTFGSCFYEERLNFNEIYSFTAQTEFYTKSKEQSLKEPISGNDSEMK
jgi:hypothetical protein